MKTKLVPMFKQKSINQTQHEFKLCYWPLKVLWSMVLFVWVPPPPRMWICLFFYTQWYKFSGRISRRTLLSALLVRPFQLAFKKLANFPMVLFNFLKNLKRWWCSHSATRPSKELWIGPITTAPTWWKVRYNNSSFIWMGHTSAHQPSFYSFTFHLHFLYFSLFR